MTDGLVVEGVSDEEVAVLDAFEDEQYERLEVELESGSRAWAYVIAPGYEDEMSDQEWDLDSFVQFSRPLDRLFTGQIDRGSRFRLRADTVAHRHRHRASPAFGPSSWTVSMLRGSPALWATAARVSIGYLLFARLGPRWRVTVTQSPGGFERRGAAAARVPRRGCTPAEQQQA